MTPSGASARDVFAALYAGCEGLVEIRHFEAGDTFTDCQKAWHTVDDVDGFADTCTRLRDVRQPYWGVATRRDDSSGGKENLQHLGAVFTDIDFKDCPEAEARRHLATFPLPPSLLVASGGGLHAYWLLREPEDVSTARARDRVEAINRGLAAHLHGDPACKDASRILRVPNTRNLKPGRARALVRVELFSPDQRCNLADLEDVLPDLPAASHDTPAVVGGHIPNGTRNATLHRVGRALHAKGLPMSAIAAALHGINATACDPPLPEREVDVIARQADRQRDREDFTPASPRTGLRVRRFSDVQQIPLRPLWPGYIYRGKLTLAAGPGEVGKTYGLCHIAAQGSRGRPMPDAAEVGTFSTLIVSAEDGAEDTLLPRLRAMDADTDRIFVIDGEDAASFLLGRDLPALEEVITTHQIDCVVFDALNSFLGGRLDTSQDASIRSVLGPLVAMAQRLDVALVGVAHFGKADQANIVHKILGSVGFANLARVVVGFTPDPDTAGRAFMASVKNNLAPRPDPLAYRILASGRVQWESAAGLDLVSTFNAKPGRQAGATAGAADWLRDLLLPLGSIGMPSADILEQGAQAGFRRDTLFEVKKALGVKARKLGFSGGWTWAIEHGETPAPLARAGCTSDASTLREISKDYTKSSEESGSDASGDRTTKRREESEESNPLQFADASGVADGLAI